jgi:hypothetical protein
LTQVGQGKVDDAVFASKWYGWLGAFGGHHTQPGPFTTSQDYSTDFHKILLSLLEDCTFFVTSFYQIAGLISGLFTKPRFLLQRTCKSANNCPTTYIGKRWFFR